MILVQCKSSFCSIHNPRICIRHIFCSGCNVRCIGSCCSLSICMSCLDIHRSICNSHCNICHSICNHIYNHIYNSHSRHSIRRICCSSLDVCNIDIRYSCRNSYSSCLHNRRNIYSNHRNIRFHSNICMGCFLKLLLFLFFCHNKRSC